MQVDFWVEHLDPASVNVGDVVMGTLPVYLAAEVCQRGAKFYFLTLHVAPEQRGQELSVEEMQQARCNLTPYLVVPLA